MKKKILLSIFILSTLLLVSFIMLPSLKVSRDASIIMKRKDTTIEVKDKIKIEVDKELEDTKTVVSASAPQSKWVSIIKSIGTSAKEIVTFLSSMCSLILLVREIRKKKKVAA